MSKENQDEISTIQFPSESSRILIEVFYQLGDEAFVCGASGQISANMIGGIERNFAENQGMGFDKGDGNYLFEAYFVSPQYGDEGRIEIGGHWELSLVGLKSIKTT